MPLDLPTDRKIVGALILLSDEYELPENDMLRQVALRAKPNQMAAFTGHYLHAAWHELRATMADEAVAASPGLVEDLPTIDALTRAVWPTELVNATLTASHLAYPIRFAAQGPQGVDPAEQMWSALVAGLTVAVVRSRRNNANPLALVNSVRAVVTMMGDL